MSPELTSVDGIADAMPRPLRPDGRTHATAARWTSKRRLTPLSGKPAGAGDSAWPCAKVQFSCPDGWSLLDRRSQLVPRKGSFAVRCGREANSSVVRRRR